MIKDDCSLHNLGNKNSKRNSGSNDNTFIVDDDDDHIDDDDGDDSIQRSRAEIVHNKWVDGRIIQITKHYSLVHVYILSLDLDYS